MRVSALWLLGACWTAEPPRVTTAPVQAREAAPAPRADTTVPGTTTARQRVYHDDPWLADQLRVSGARDLMTWATGPLVVLDLDTGTFATLCGSAAQLAARSFGARFADPSKHPPQCGVHVTTLQRRCTQLEPGTTVPPTSVVLMVELGTTAKPRLVTAVTGHTNPNIALMDQLDQYVANATCP
jgi:hypothetical protein